MHPHVMCIDKLHKHYWVKQLWQSWAASDVNDVIRKSVDHRERNHHVLNSLWMQLCICAVIFSLTWQNIDDTDVPSPGRYLCFWEKFWGYFYMVSAYKEDETEVVRNSKNILYIILWVTSFLLNEWRDIRVQKSWLKYEIKLICIINCTTSKKPKIWTLEVIKNLKSLGIFLTNFPALVPLTALAHQEEQLAWKKIPLQKSPFSKCKNTINHLCQFCSSSKYDTTRNILDCDQSNVLLAHLLHTDRCQDIGDNIGRDIANFSSKFVAMATTLGRGRIWHNSPTQKTPW